MTRKNYLLFPIISLFLLLPQPQVRSNLGLREKIIIGCVGALSSIVVGAIIYARSTLSNETEIQRAKQLIDDSNKLFIDVSTKYKASLSQSIEQLKANLEKKKNISYPFYKFVSELNDAIRSLNNMIKKLEAKRKHLITRKAAKTPTPDRQRYLTEYSSLIDAISLLTKDLQALSNDLANLHKKVTEFQEYKDEAAQRVRQNAIFRQRQNRKSQTIIVQQHCNHWNCRNQNNSGTTQKIKSVPVKAAPETKNKAFNPALKSFWDDPFNY